MTALETFTNSFQATLDHGAPSRHGRYLREVDAGVDVKAAIPITTRTSLFGGEWPFLLMRVPQAALCPKTTRSAMI